MPLQAYAKDVFGTKIAEAIGWLCKVNEKNRKEKEEKYPDK